MITSHLFSNSCHKFNKYQINFNLKFLFNRYLNLKLPYILKTYIPNFNIIDKIIFSSFQAIPSATFEPIQEIHRTVCEISTKRCRSLVNQAIIMNQYSAIVLSLSHSLSLHTYIHIHATLFLCFCPPVCLSICLYVRAWNRLRFAAPRNASFHSSVFTSTNVIILKTYLHS